MFRACARRTARSSRRSTPPVRRRSSTTGRSRVAWCRRSRPVCWPRARAAAPRSSPRAVPTRSRSCSPASRWAPSSRRQHEERARTQAPPAAGAGAPRAAAAPVHPGGAGPRAEDGGLPRDPGHRLAGHRRARSGEGRARRRAHLRAAVRGEPGWWWHRSAAPLQRGLSGGGGGRGEHGRAALVARHRERARRRARRIGTQRDPRHARGRRHRLRRDLDGAPCPFPAHASHRVRHRSEGEGMTAPQYKGETCVLAYSGGLDTSVAVAWLRETHGFEVVTCTGDLGSVRDLAAVQQEEVASGARKAVVQDARDIFVRFFVWPALQAGALYEERYPLATALGRPLLAKLLVDVARDENARFVAHGCTGKGNDQVRFDLAVGALAPDLKVIAPMRGGMNMTRDEEIEYARERGIPVEATTKG